MFTPIHGEDEPILTNMFQLGGSTTNDFLFIQNSYYVVPEMFPRINDAVDEIFLETLLHS